MELERAFVQLESALSARVIAPDGTIKEDRGVICRKVVTTAGVNFLVDCFQGITTIADFKYHATGEGIGDEAIGDITLGTERGTRVAGSQAEGASANIYKTIATVNYGTTYAITEHGIFSASTSGTLWDRSKFAAVNVGNGDSIEFTYELTCTAGG